MNTSMSCYCSKELTTTFIRHSDFLLKESKPISENSTDGAIGRRIHVSSLFHVLIHGLGPIWPARESLAGVSLGDVWPCSALARAEGNTGNGHVINSPNQLNADIQIAVQHSDVGLNLVPFHKLTQWLAYSLVVPLQTTLGWAVEGMEDMTGLPEYRNGEFSGLKQPHTCCSSQAFPRWIIC